MVEKQVFFRFLRGDDERLPEEKISPEERVKKIKDITGYGFNDPVLLEQALTHHSFYEEESEEGCSSYERLEYVGDAVLGLLIAKHHYFMYPDLDPGRLTKLRASNVDTEKLARVAVKHELYKFLRHNLPALAGQIKEFKNAMAEYPVHSSGLIEAPKVLADLVESLVGAIYLDSNSSTDTTWKIVKKLLEPIISPASLNSHPVSMLFEICQKNRLKVKVKDTWRETGEMEFLVDGELVGSAKYSAKRSIAYNRAAQNAYCNVLTKLSLQDSIHIA